MKNKPVFVYGTLRKGAPNHSVIFPYIQQVEFGVVPGRLVFDIKDGQCFLPYLLKTPKENVLGELYYIKPEKYTDCIEMLDRFEMEGSIYSREEVNVYTKQGVRKGWAYRALTVPKQYKVIPQADYFAAKYGVVNG